MKNAIPAIVRNVFAGRARFCARRSCVASLVLVAAGRAHLAALVCGGKVGAGNATADFGADLQSCELVSCPLVLGTPEHRISKVS